MSRGTMRSLQLTRFGAPNLTFAEVPIPRPGPRQLLVHVSAVALNHQDELIVEGTLLPGLRLPHVPASDAAGEVVAVGEAVQRFRVGDRVLSHFLTTWISGPAPATAYAAALGSSLPGVLSEYVVLDEEGAVAAPPSLSDAQAATLPIAALTAWSALVEAAPFVPGQTLVVQGTGGVSLFALQFAKAFGARAIVLSGSDEKLARARALGAVAGINYRTRPDWDAAVLELTAGRGADHVLELAAGDNLRRSVNAVAPGGRISQIGILGALEASFPVVPFMKKRIVLQGFSVGHRSAFEAMNAAVEACGLQPVVEEVYPFDQARRAFEHLARGPFGKVVVALR